MLRLERISAGNALVFKAVRLRALQDSPQAFGSTYARESQFSDEEWVRRGERWSGDQGAGFLAMDEGESCGIVCCYLQEEDPTRGQLIAMWAAPTHRGSGVGRRLVEEVTAWARGRGVRTMELMVVSNNEGAMRFYERLGFVKTGRTEVYPNDARLIEFEMVRAIL